MRYLRIRQFAAETGYTEKAIRRKIEEGIFVEGIHWRRAPDNCIVIDKEAYEAWVEGAMESARASKSARARAGSCSSCCLSDTAAGYQAPTAALSVINLRC